MRRWGPVAVAAMLFLVGAPGVSAEDQNVAIRGFAFDPDRVEVEVGDTVTWQNFDSVTHTATADDGTFDSGDVAFTETFAHTFTAPGEFSYFCRYHSNMQAVVVVQGEAQPPPETTQPAPEEPPAEEPPPATTAAPQPPAASDEAEPATTTTEAAAESPDTTDAERTTTSTTALSAAPAGTGGDSGGGGLLVVILGLLALAAAGVGAGWWWFRGRPSESASGP